MKSNLDRAKRINQIADDWLLVYPNTHKAEMTSGLIKFSDDHLDEIFSFHERIKAFPRERKREVLADLPKDFKNVIDEMLRAYTAEIKGANESYYNRDAPELTDSQYDLIVKLLRSTLAQKKLWSSYLKQINEVGAKPSGRFRKVRHALPMLSLDNAFAEQDVV